jgi:hypothetical protein
MSIVTGIYRDGKVELDAPVDWPNGSRVEVSSPLPKIGLTEDEWPTSPEGIVAWLTWAASVEPVELTPDEEAEWAAARVAVKDYTLQRMREHWGTGE